MSLVYTSRPCFPFARFRSLLVRLLVAASLTVVCANCGGGNIGEGAVEAFARLLRPTRVAVAFAAGRFVSNGKFGVETSDTGSDFARASNPIGTLGWADAYGDAGWIATDAPGKAFTSVDGVTWSMIAIPGDPNVTIYGAAFGAQSYVLVGTGGSVFSSRDARNWELVASGTEDDLFNVAYAGGQFIAVGRNGTIVTSPDGKAWTIDPSPTDRNLHGIAEGDGVFLLTGADGTLLRSLDGVSWDEVGAGTNSYLSGATFALARFVVVGQGGRILISDDHAESFVAVDSGLVPRDSFEANLFAVTYGEGRFVAVGDAIVSSTDGVAWAGK